MAGDCCDLGDDFYGHRGLEEILNYYSTDYNNLYRLLTSQPFMVAVTRAIGIATRTGWAACLGSPRAVMARTLEWKLVYRLG